MITYVLEYLSQKSATLKIVFFVCLGLIVVLDVVLPRENSHAFVDTLYAYWTFFALAGGCLLILLSKGLAYLFGKGEDYYD